MASRRASIAQQRLARVRAIKAQFFAEEMPIDQRLDVKDVRIAELESEVAELRSRLRAERTEPEPAPPRKPAFDFYRDD